MNIIKEKFYTRFPIRKIIIIFLIFIMIYGLFACAKDNSENTGNGEKDKNYNAAEGYGNEQETDAKINRWAQEPSDLPDNNFNGSGFMVIVPDDTENRVYNYFAVEDQNGEPIIDAIYKRNLAIEERYNITVNQVNKPNPTETVRKSILAGDSEYNLIVDAMYNMRSLTNENLIADLYNVPYIGDNLDKPWWDQALKRDLSINKKLYFETGNIVLKDKMRLACLYFNKDMCQSLEIEYPYKYVYDGTWTIDKLMEITKGINQDLDGNGVMDQYDRWGMMSEHGFALMAFQGAGETTVSLNKDGVPEITMNTPRAISVIQKILSFCTDSVALFHADTIKGVNDIWLTASEYFQENRFLVRSSLFEAIPRDLRAMPADFGVLPMVKFDEQQGNYYTYASADGYFISIPSNADIEYVGLITEALAYESGTTLMPAFYDLSLTTKVLRDNESEGMLDIMFNNKVYDIGYIYGIGSLPTLLTDMVKAGKTDFVSSFEKIHVSAEKALEKFIAAYDKD